MFYFLLTGKKFKPVRNYGGHKKRALPTRGFYYRKYEYVYLLLHHRTVNVPLPRYAELFKTKTSYVPKKNINHYVFMFEIYMNVTFIRARENQLVQFCKICI